MRKSGLIILIATTAFLVVVGVVSLSAYFLLRKQPFEVPPWQDPLTLVNYGGIDPALAVGGLGGLSDKDLAAQALTEGRTDTAFAVLVFSPSISDRESAGASPGLPWRSLPILLRSAYHLPLSPHIGYASE